MTKTSVPLWRRLFGLGGKETKVEFSPQAQTDTVANRRAWIRYPTNQGASLRSSADKPDNRQWSAQVLDISRGGLKLVADRRFEPGALLKIELLNPNNGQVARPLLVQVRYVVSKGPSHWSLGVSFTGGEISEEEIKALL